MSAVPVAPEDLRLLSADLRDLANECVAQARITAGNAGAEDADASLAAKNWASAALSAAQAWMTVARGPGR